MKALILAGGRGKRLGEISNDKNKCMLEIGGKPLIEYSLDCASRTEISEIVIVVGYRAEDIINTYGNKYNGKPIKYVIQSPQKGLVHAIECAQEAIEGEDFMLMLGDELLVNPAHQAMTEKYKKENLFGICGVVKVEDKNLIKKTYAIIQGEDEQIFRLIEKPTKPMNNMMGTGNCIFKNEILSYIPQTPINQKRGEKELPDLIQCAIDEGKIVKSFVICDQYFNINEPAEINRVKSYFAHF
jgi:NDP-sugar pyrophosphorylase family protein